MSHANPATPCSLSRASTDLGRRAADGRTAPGREHSVAGIRSATQSKLAQSPPTSPRGRYDVGRESRDSVFAQLVLRPISAGVRPTAGLHLVANTPSPGFARRLSSKLAQSPPTSPRGRYDVGRESRDSVFAQLVLRPISAGVRPTAGLHLVANTPSPGFARRLSSKLAQSPPTSPRGRYDVGRESRDSVFAQLVLRPISAGVRPTAGLHLVANTPSPGFARRLDSKLAQSPPTSPRGRYDVGRESRDSVFAQLVLRPISAGVRLSVVLHDETPCLGILTGLRRVSVFCSAVLVSGRAFARYRPCGAPGRPAGTPGSALARGGPAGRSSAPGRVVVRPGAAEPNYLFFLTACWCGGGRRAGVRSGPPRECVSPAALRVSAGLCALWSPLEARGSGRRCWSSGVPDARSSRPGPRRCAPSCTSRTLTREPRTLRPAPLSTSSDVHTTIRDVHDSAPPAW